MVIVSNGIVMQKKEIEIVGFQFTKAGIETPLAFCGRERRCGN
jgi:hypothetical protein